MQSPQAIPQSLATDPLQVPCVVASSAEVRHALELRERLRRLFPNRPARDVPIWSVGAD
jgi:hypothetical protein